MGHQRLLPLPADNSPASFLSKSPAKSKPGLSQTGELDTEVSHTLLAGSKADTQNPIAAFSKSGQPMMDTTLKDMLLSLQSPIHSDIVSMVHHFKTEITDLGHRVTNIENRMGEWVNLPHPSMTL